MTGLYYLAKTLLLRDVLNSRNLANKLISLSFLLSLAAPLSAQEVKNAPLTQEERCLLDQLQASDADVTVLEIRERCDELSSSTAASAEPTVIDIPVSDSLITQRLTRERIVTRNRLGLAPHQRNYVLPLTYMKDPNSKPYFAALGDILP